MYGAPGDKAAYRSRDERSPIGGIRLTSRDQAILRDVFLQRAVTRKQLMGLGHFGSLTSASERLRALYDHSYLDRHAIATDLATTEIVYTIGHRAIPELVSNLGVDRVEVKRCVSSGAPYALSHAVAVTDARIAFAAPNDGRTSDWISEIEARHEFTVGESRHILKPDGALLIARSGLRHVAFLEVDRGNVSRSQFARSCRAYRTYFNLNLPQEVYEARSASLICIVHAKERRLQSLLAVAGDVGIPSAFAAWKDIALSTPYNSVWRTPKEPALMRVFSEVI